MPVSCEAVVSIQLATAPDAVSGFLAWGALVAPDRVVTPGPLDWLRDSSAPFNVLLASARANGPGVVERLEVERAEIIGLEANPDGAVAVLELARPARHKPVMGAAFSERDLAGRLATEPDVWTAFEDMGVVPAGLREFPVDRVLGPVVDWERARRENLLTVRMLADPGEGAFRWCRLIFACEPGDCSGQWW